MRIDFDWGRWGIGGLVFGLWSLVFGVWVLDFGLWELVFGLWVLVFGYWSLGIGLWILVFGYWKLKRRISNRSGLAKDGVSCSKNPDALGWLIMYRGALRISPTLADSKSPAHRKSENIIEIMEQSRQGKLLKFVDR